MPSLVIPESGLSLASSRNASSTPGSATAFGLTLNDSVIEEMIRCVQNGKPIQLSLGDNPSLLYGTKVQHLSTTIDPFTHELFRTSTSDSESESSKMSHLKPNLHKGVKRVENKPHAAFLAMFHTKKLLPSKKPLPTSAVKPSTTISKMTSASATAGTDAALAALQSSLASENAKKAENTTKYIKDGSGLPGPGRKGPAKVTGSNKFLTQNRGRNDTPRSMPSSPALTGVGSPSLGPTSIPLSQQQAEQAKAARKPIVHLLALEPLSEEALQSRIPNASKADIKQALLKVGDQNEVTKKWELRKGFWKELEVWAYKYESQEDRQRAIDNAVKQYDRMRLGVSEPEWDRLLPKGERGTGKCLSKLQVQIAQGTAARAPKVIAHNAEDSGRDTPARKDDDDDVFGGKQVPKVKGEVMARSASQPPATKSKKVSEKEAQAKHLIPKNTTKPAAKPAPRKEPIAKTGGKILSSQFVSDSDEEEDDYLVPAKPAAKSVKRSREDDGESSDSSVPLSKKVKKDIHRVSDASQTSRTTNTSTYSTSSSKTKGNSPQKSSPLASSPPTNASEFDNSSGGRTSSSASPAQHKLKSSRSPIHKRHQKSSSVTSSSSIGSQKALRPEIIDLARKYRSYYPKYLNLYKEVANLDRRNTKLEQDLIDMHERLGKMKDQISKGVVDSR